MNITLIIILVTLFTSYKCFQSQSLFNKLKNHPYSVVKNREYYRLITSGFVHGDWVHLIVNMFVLYEFGKIVESIYIELFGQLTGIIFYLAMYFIVLILADIPSLRQHHNHPSFSSIGASGAVSGVLFTYILFYPWSWLGLFFVIPIPAVVFGILYLVYSTWASKSKKDNIDHSAHFAGAIAGMLIIIILHPKVINLFLERITQFQGPF
ncbi:MAG TPA: rhomboid family intramembrane serine protease [Saprospiraceae bacterium]|nr:rhomboid family intramembrane serine protease [Saprospiraceae bacterium]